MEGFSYETFRIFLFRIVANDTERNGTSLQSKSYFHSQIRDFKQRNVTVTILVFQYDTEQIQNYLASSAQPGPVIFFDVSILRNFQKYVLEHVPRKGAHRYPPRGLPLRKVGHPWVLLFLQIFVKPLSQVIHALYSYKTYEI